MRLTTSLSTKVGQPGMTVADEVTNISAQPGEMELLYHINFGVPLVSPGATVAVPVKRLAPRDAVAVADVPTWNVYGPETPGSIEVCHFFDLAADAGGQHPGGVAIGRRRQGVSVKFNKRQLPCFTIWKNRQGVIDGYVTGLEPAANDPNPKSFEKAHGRVVVLGAGRNSPRRDCHRGPHRRCRREGRRARRGGDPSRRQARDLREARSELGCRINDD